MMDYANPFLAEQQCAERRAEAAAHRRAAAARRRTVGRSLAAHVVALLRLPH